MFIGILIFPPIGAICLLSRELIQRIHVFLIFVCRLGHCVLFNRCDGQGHSMLTEEERAQRIFRNTRGWAPSYAVTAGLCPSLNCGDFHLHRSFPSPTYVPQSFTPRYRTLVFSSCQDSSPLSAVFAISSIGRVCFAASTMVLGSSFFLNYYFIVWKSEATCPRSSRLWWARQELMLPLLLVLSLDWDRCGGDSTLGIVFTLGRTWWWRAEYSFNRSLGLPW